LTNVKNKMQEVQKNVLENMAELGFHSGALQTPAINRPPLQRGFQINYIKTWAEIVA